MDLNKPLERKLPSYPKKAHGTGQAAIYLNGSTRYLARWGTAKSWALYHLACLHAIVRNKIPRTADLNAELEEMTASPKPRRMLFVYSAALLFLGFTAGYASTVPALWNMQSELESVKGRIEIVSDATYIDSHPSVSEELMRTKARRKVLARMTDALLAAHPAISRREQIETVRTQVEILKGMEELHRRAAERN